MKTKCVQFARKMHPRISDVKLGTNPIFNILPLSFFVAAHELDVRLSKLELTTSLPLCGGVRKTDTSTKVVHFTTSGNYPNVSHRVCDTETCNAEQVSVYTDLCPKSMAAPHYLWTKV